nr:hypothetical protein CFP56_44182 [Quercus suber]POF27026.1 hypothetical protein CFP56_40391 [Quercus suber]
MDYYNHHSLSLMVGSRVPLYFRFLLSELQGSLPKLLVKEPMKGPAVLSKVLDIVMNLAKQRVLPFFFSRWLGYSKWPDNSIPNPFIQNMIQFFYSA